MENKESPKDTGVSGITGKIVKVRHAVEADMCFIMDYLEKYHLDTENLHYDQFVVATENGNPIGFGRLKKVGETYEVGCVVAIEERRKQGVGALIIKHLIDYSPVKMVYAITDLADDFKKLGFSETKEGSQELMGALDKACRISGKHNAILMVYKKD